MILKYHEYFIEVLETLQSRGKTNLVTLREVIAAKTKVTPEEMVLTTSKGTNILTSRIYWAVQYLFQAGALDRPEKSFYQINNLGQDLMKKFPNGFTDQELKETEGFKQWMARSGTASRSASKNDSFGEAPQESIEQAISEIEETIANELVLRIQNMPPDFLEKTVLKLLGAMGYGIDNASLQHTGKSGDEGIDGVINQDALGLQQIYIQAKRYKSGNNIGRESIQTFMGALQGQGATGGVFITTSGFTQQARDYVTKQMTTKIVLIDGEMLGRLLIRHEIGVVVQRTYKLMEVDENFFDSFDS